MATTRVTSPPHLVMAMHRAVVEVFTLQQAGEPLAKLSNPPDARDLTGAVQVSSSSAHGIHLRFPADDVRQDLLRILDQDLASPTEDVEEDAVGGHMEDEEASRMSSDESGDQAGMASDHVDLETETNAVTSRLDEGPSSSSTATTATTITEEDADRLKTQIATWSDDWLNIPLTDPTIKFAVRENPLSLAPVEIPSGDETKSSASQADGWIDRQTRHAADRHAHSRPGYRPDRHRSGSSWPRRSPSATDQVGASAGPRRPVDVAA